MRKATVPSYRLHKPSGQARVILDGEHIYLGRFGTPESKAKYVQVISERSVGGPTGPDESNVSAAQLTIVEVLAKYRDYSQIHYRRGDKTTHEFENMKHALRPVRELYGSTPIANFGPKQLKAVRQKMVDDGLSRGVINSRVNRIRRFVRWAVSEQLVQPGVLEALRAVDGLRYGHPHVRETARVLPAPEKDVDALLPFLSRQVAAMVRLQQLTGMRPGEVVLMRWADIDVTGDVWIYEPLDHKNRYRGHRRLVTLGPKAQEDLRPFLCKKPDEFLFSPADAEAGRNVARRAARKTPMTPSQAKRKPKKSPKRPKRDRYGVHSYRRAISYAFKKAKKQNVEIPHWHPHQLRHSYATLVRKKHGVEAAQVGLGHSRADVTQVYAERDLDLAKKVAKEIG